MFKTTFQTKDLDLVIDLANKMQDPLIVKTRAIDLANCDPVFSMGHSWRDLSLADGYPSLVLFYSTLHTHFPNDKWDFTAHRYIQKIVESIEKDPVFDFSLFSGLTGVLYAISAASCDNTRYQNLTHQLKAILIPSIQKYYFEPLKQEIESGMPSPFYRYDLIQGIVGVGIYLLSEIQTPDFQPTLLSLIQLLIQRIEPFTVHGVKVPGWYLPSEFQLNEKDKTNFPKGCFNLGMAHGCTGILAFLSIAYLKGIDCPSLKEAIQNLASWIQSKAFLDQGELTWQDHMSWDEVVHHTHTSTSTKKMAWCYGKPGILMSLYLAGRSLNDASLLKYAQDHYLEIFLLPVTRWHLRGPTFCHGLAGLYTMTEQMASYTQNSELKNQALRIKEKMVDFYNCHVPFGFKDVEESSYDRSGLLNGAVGIALSLLDTKGHFNWKVPFLISV